VVWRSWRVTCWLWVSLLLASSGCTLLRPVQPAKSPSALQPWDLAALSRPPQYQWADRQGPVWSLFYEGQPYKGKPTHVFAYYASPATVGSGAATGRGFPGVVLVHGGGGTAF